MTGKERIARQLNHQKVDRIGAYEAFWSQTLQKWENEGKIAPGTDLHEHFAFDLDVCGAIRYGLHPEREEIILEEDEETKIVLTPNNARLRRHKLHATTPENLGYDITCQADWLERAKPLLKAEPGRLNFEAYRLAKAKAERNGTFFCWAGINVFECIHPICGHENMLIGMALEPDWVRDMAETYAQLNIDLLDMLIAAEGKPDAIWYYEDLGFKQRPFMSPAMYRELLMPAHKKTFDHAHALGLKVILHSCGFVEPLLPSLLEAGIDCLQAIEVKAGMDLLRIYRNYGDRIALMGGLDVRPVTANDRPAILRELESKIPIARQNYGYILHSDHSIPENTEYETYQFFLEQGRRLGTY